MTDLIGQSVGSYHILEQLGEGGMAIVYKAYDTRLERDMAIKVIRRGAFPPDQLENILKRFEREAKALARITHPNIVPVIDYGDYEGAPYLVMPYLPGGTLKQRLGKPMPWQEAIRLLLPIARALQYAHQEGLVHRDVKPSNILITRSGEPMLTDFGIAKLLESEETQLTNTGTSLGTPEYMSPEQWIGQAGPQSDIYSLGVVLYELVTGKTPYTADTPAAIMLKQNNDPLPSPRKYVVDLPEEVEKVLLKALAKEPQNRYQNMGEFVYALEQIGRKLPIPASQMSNQATFDASIPLSASIKKPPAPLKKIPAKGWMWGLIGMGGIIVLAGIISIVAFLLKHTPPASVVQTPSALMLAATDTAPVPVVTDTLAPPVPTNMPAPVAFTCTDKIGCVTIAPNDPIHIAYLLAVSGSNSILGNDARNGVEIAIDDAGGKILGHAIRFDGEDGSCSEAGGRMAGTKLASDPTIITVIGTSCSSEALVAEPLLSKAGFVTISPSNTTPNLTEAGNKYNFPGYLRTAPNDKFQASTAADFAYNILGIRKVATIHDGTLYAVTLQQAFAENFAKYGGTITTQVSVNPNATDMSSVITRIATGKPDLIYFPIFMNAGAYIIQQAKKTPGLENTKLMGADALFSPDVMKVAGADVEGFMVSSPIISGATYDAFVKKYVTKFNEQPISIYHAHAYDAFNIVKAAIEKVAVKDADGTLHIGRQALRDAVYATLNFQGLTGVLSCTPTGDCANPVLGVYVFHAGQYPPEKIWPK